MTDKKTTLKILDSVNCKFCDLDPFVRRQIVDKLKFFVPYARHTPMFKTGRWDGKVAFATAGGATYINLLDRVLDIVYDAGYEIEIEDLRPQYHFEFPEIDESYLADRTWPKGHPMEGQPIMLRDHQVAAANTFFKNTQSIQELATGAGKTILCAALSVACEKYGKTLVIVPSKSLVRQTEADYVNIGLDTGVYFGDQHDIDKQHTIATWQSLEAWAKASRQGTAIVDIKEFLKNVICVITDEVHSAKAQILKDLLSGPLAHCPIRWGCTGTVPKEDVDFLSLLSCIGPVVGSVSAKSLMDKDILSNLHINIIQTDDSHVEFSDYHAETEWLATNQERTAFLANFYDGLRKEHGNTLILVNSIESGKKLEKLIPNSKFISGVTKLKDRSEEYEDFAGIDDKILIATYGIAAVGISITKISCLVLAGGVAKSFTRCIQAIGRGLRRGNGKDFVHVYDVTSNLKYSKKHLSIRKQYYKDAEYPMSIKKVNYR